VRGEKGHERGLSVKTEGVVGEIYGVEVRECDEGFKEMG
jgi:hypothetical protein